MIAATWPPSIGSSGSRLKAPMKMFSEAMSSSTKLTLYCQPQLAATAAPVASAAPTTLPTWPAAVLDRSLLNSLGSAEGRAATACAEPARVWPKVVPAYLIAPSGLATWNTDGRRDAQVGAAAAADAGQRRVQRHGWPSRLTVMVTGSPGRVARIALSSWVQVVTGWPSKAVITSPTCSPACLAGDAASAAAQVLLS